MKWLFGFLSLLFVSLCFGVRVHPENAAQIFDRPSFDDYYQIEFFSGQTLAGKIVREGPETLEMGLEAGTTVFNKQEIKSRHWIDSETVKAGKYQDIIIQRPLTREPLFSLSYQDSIFFAAEKRVEGLLSRAAEKIGSPSKVLNVSQTDSRSPIETAPHASALPEEAGTMSRENGLHSLEPADQDYAALLRAGLEKLQSSNR